MATMFSSSVGFTYSCSSGYGRSFGMSDTGVDERVSRDRTRGRAESRRTGKGCQRGEGLTGGYRVNSAYRVNSGKRVNSGSRANSGAKKESGRCAPAIRTRNAFHAVSAVQPLDANRHPGIRFLHELRPHIGDLLLEGVQCVRVLEDEVRARAFELSGHLGGDHIHGLRLAQGPIAHEPLEP